MWIWRDDVWEREIKGALRSASLFNVIQFTYACSLSSVLLLLIHFCFLFHSLDSSFFSNTSNSLNLFRAVSLSLWWDDFFLSLYCVRSATFFSHYYYHFLHSQMYHLRFLSFKPFFPSCFSIEWHTNWWMIDENTELKPIDRYFVLVTYISFHSSTFDSFSNLQKSKLSIDLRFGIIKIDPYRWDVWVSTRWFAPIKKNNYWRWTHRQPVYVAKVFSIDTRSHWLFGKHWWWFCFVVVVVVDSTP